MATKFVVFVKKTLTIPEIIELFQDELHFMYETSVDVSISDEGEVTLTPQDSIKFADYFGVVPMEGPYKFIIGELEEAYKKKLLLKV